MKELNKEQCDWVKKNFCLSKADMPTEFYTKTEFIEIICGKGIFRSKDYLGDSMSFVDDCLTSYFAFDKNKAGFQRIFNQIHNYLTKEAINNEYYELLDNLKEINDEFVIFVNRANEQNAEYHVKYLLEEIGLIDKDLI